ncbi:hypothetical protein IT401_00905 [Candidatus Nomurabacteria bacterium]|nr:hypothetical protein [Candidatus Nomurabacteria bacterium]
MITFLVIALITFALLSWVAYMYLWWKKDQGVPETPLTLADAQRSAEQGARLARRGWYQAQIQTQKAASWVQQKAGRAFFTIFPDAKEAFTKKDELAGFSHGPSSYFLRSISEREEKKRVVRRKKTSETTGVEI